MSITEFGQRSFITWTAEDLRKEREAEMEIQMSNSRPIKFRAWNPKFKKMEYDVWPTSKNTVGHWIKMYKREEWQFSDNGQTKVVIEQFADLKDKTGTEIYEGDIVRCSLSKTQHYKGIIQFENGSYFIQTFWYRFNPIGRWDLQEAPLSGKSTTKLDIQCDIDKVIGNIHQKPELLEQDNG